MISSPPALPLDSVARDLVAIDARRLPSDLLEHARQRIFDACCATVVGLTSPDGALLVEMTRQLSRGRSAAVVDLVRLLVGACRCTEMDDIHLEACVTPGAVVVPTALALVRGAPVEPSDATVLSAVMAGYEAGLRLGAAVDGAGLAAAGAWPTRLCAPAAAAATCSRMLQLDATRTAAAMTIALAGSTEQPPPETPDSPARWLAIGEAAASGVVAAHAARAGIEVPRVPVRADAWPPAIRSADPARLVRTSGDWELRRVEDKPFVTSRQGLAAIEALRDLVDNGTHGPPIQAVRAGVPGQWLAMLDLREPAGRLDSIVSLRYQLALALTDPDDLWDAGRRSLRRDAETATLMSRMTVEEDAGLTWRFPHTWGGSIRVVREEGAEERSRVLHPRGSRQHPLDWSGLASKWRRAFARAGLAATDVDQALERCRALAGGGHGEVGALAESVAAAITHEPKEGR